MKDKSTYYSLFEDILETESLDIATEFSKVKATGSPREVFLWLDKLRLVGKLPKALEQPLTDFYGLFC